MIIWYDILTLLKENLFQMTIILFRQNETKNEFL